MKNDPFIGKVFITPKDGKITVIRSPAGKESKKKYEVSCSTCNRDSEIFPDNFYITKYNLTKGIIPCACSKSYRWSVEQYKIRIKRKCGENGCIFLGFEEWDGSRTKLKLSCNDHGEWSSTSIDNFFSEKRDKGCKSCQKVKLRTPDKEMINRFLSTGKFTEGTTFKRIFNEGSNSSFIPWEYNCPVCSNDIYVRNNLCKGVFYCLSSSLKRGHRSCRCSKVYQWTKDQREFGIKRICKENGLSFKEWEPEEKYFNSSSVFKWICAKGHHTKSEAGRFINEGHKCNDCFRESIEWGLYKNRLEDADNLYLMLFISKYESFIKVGRAFNLLRRLDNFPKEYDIKILSFYENNHLTVYNTEQRYHRLINKYKYKPFIKFSGSKRECFSIEALKMFDLREDLWLV